MKKTGRGSFENNYKKSSISIGASRDLVDQDKFHIATSNFADGISKDDFPMICNDMVEASYGRGKLTAIGGYLAKQYFAAYQNVLITEKDCGTKKTLKINLTNDNYKDFLYRYIETPKGTVYLDSESIKQYIGSSINLRTPYYCISENYCSTCMGELFKMIGIDSAPGLVSQKIGSTVLNKLLKRFHDKTIKIHTFDATDYIKKVK